MTKGPAMTTASTERCAGHSDKGAIFTRIDQTQPTRPQAHSAGRLRNAPWHLEATVGFNIHALLAHPHHPRPLSGITALSIYQRSSPSAWDKITMANAQSAPLARCFAASSTPLEPRPHTGQKPTNRALGARTGSDGHRVAGLPAAPAPRTFAPSYIERKKPSGSPQDTAHKPLRGKRAAHEASNSDIRNENTQKSADKVPKICFWAQKTRKPDKLARKADLSGLTADTKVFAIYREMEMKVHLARKQGIASKVCHGSCICCT